MADPNKSLHVTRLEIRNVQRITVLDITPDSKKVVLKGKNKAGKSAVMDAIAMTLGGKDLMSPEPLRTGAEKGFAKVHLGDDLIVTRKWTKNSTTLTVENGEGAVYKTPQEMLDRLVGLLAFDPFEFTQMKADKQLDTLRKLVGIDFSALNAQYKKIYDERTGKNRDVAAVKGKLALSCLDETVPAEEIVVADLMAELKSITTHNETVADHKNLLDDYSVEYQQSSKVLKNAEENIKKIEDELRQARLDLQTVQSVVKQRQYRYDQQNVLASKLVTKDPAPVETQINTAQETNRKVQRNAEHKRLIQEAADEQAKADALTKALEAIDQTKADMLAKATFPCPGISFNDTGVLLDGKPWDNGSTAEQMAASVAMGMAMNPTVRVIFCRNAALMDEDTQKLVYDLAEKQGYQVWMEVLTSTDPAAIQIEDGHVKQPAGKSKAKVPDLERCDPVTD